MLPLKSIIGLEEMRDYKKVFKQLFAEFLGTFLYLSLTVLVESDPSYTTVSVALANGLLLATIVQIVGNVSGGHVNPAVTAGALVCGHIKTLKALCYVVAQVLGGLAGTTVAYFVSEPTTRQSFGLTVPFPQLGTGQTITLEGIITFILVSTTISVVDNNRGGRGLGSAPLAIGLSVTACQCCCLTYTGSLNPVKSLGPAVMMNVWTKHWVYWAGPVTGGLMAGVMYKYGLNLNIT